MKQFYITNKIQKSSSLTNGFYGFIRACAFLMLLLFSSIDANAQTTLLSPTGDGGMETGATFALNNWTPVNGTKNMWYVGTAAGVQGGTNAAFTGSSATTFAGTGNASVNHFYRDIAIPAGATTISLSFYLKMPTIDNTYDYVYAYTTTTSNTPVAGTIPTTGYANVFTYTTPALSGYTLKTVTLPNSLAGTTVRLVFTFKCDGASPYSAAAIDNIGLTYVPAVAPAISSFSPSTLCVAGGTTVTITGTNFTGATAVKFNGTSAASFTVVSATSITAVTPAGFTDGTISVVNPAGTATSGSSYTAAATPTVGVTSGSTICSGANVSLTATGGSTYAWSPSTGLSATTGATVTATPSTTTTYTVTGTSAAGCTSTATTTITVNQTPSTVSIATPAAFCSGAVGTLTATGGSIPSTATIGTSLASTTATTQPTAFCNRWGNYWSQTIYTASELTAAGLSAGNITSLAYNISSLGDAATNANLTIKIGTTGSSTFASSTYLSTTGYTNVYGPSTYTHTASGWQTITFTTPYVWDGTSNIVINVTMDGANATNNSLTYYTATSGNTTINTTSFTAGTTTSGTLSTSRLDVRFVGSASAPITWTPSTDLYTNLAGTTAYSGSATKTVYTKTLGSQTYTATATNGSCTSTNSITVAPVALPTVTTSGDTALCNGGTVNLTANGATTYSWSPSTGLSATTGSSVSANPTTTTTYTVTGTASGCSSSATATVTVNNPISITSQPSNQVVLEGSDATFTTAATGTGVAYQWQVSTDNGSTWSDVSGATSATFVATATTASMNTYQYHCVISGTSPCAPVTSNAVLLTVGSVSITTQPAAQTICSDATATFTIVTSGTVDSYQWEASTDNGATWTAISGANSTSLTLSGLTSANTGTKYHCVLNSGAVTSNTALLTVYDALAIGTQPSSQSVCAGTSVSFTTAATGSGVAYQWQVSTDNGSTWNNVTGATSATYTIASPTGALNNNQYHAVINGTSPCSSLTTNGATLNVIDVTATASSASICLGSSVTLNANFTGSPSSAGASWLCATTGSGATSAVTGTSASVTPTAAGSYTYTLTTNGSCTFTKTVSVTVNAVPVITSATATPVAVCSGANIALAATSIAAGPTSTATYTAPAAVTYPTSDEDFAGIVIKQGTTTILSNTSANNSLVGTIGTATGTAGSYSNFTSFGPYTLTAGGSYTFTVSSSTSGTSYSNALAIYIDYNRNGVFTDSGELVYTSSATTLGAHSENGSFTVPSTVAAGYTRMRVISNEGLITSPTQAVSYGEYEEYTINLLGNTASSYSWSWNSSPAVTAVSGTTSVANATSAPISQAFTVTATNATTGCTSTMSTSNVSVNAALTAPTASNSTQCGTGIPTCSVTGSGISGNTFHWYTVATGGTALSGQTAAALSGYSITATTNFYVAEVSADGLCESARSMVTATVTSPPAFALSASTATNCSGSASLTPVTITTGAADYSTYTWSNSATVSGDATSGWVFSPTATTTYTLTANGTTCSASATVVVTPTALPVLTATASPAAICVGASTTITALTSTVGSGSVTIGSGTDTSTLSTSGTPYRTGNTVGNQFKNQFLILASELTAAGLKPGNISSLSLDVAGAGGGTLSNLTISMGHSSLTAMTSTYVTGLTQVYSIATWPATGTLTTGLQTHNFTTPFNWDGTSNIVVSVCAQLATGGSAGTLRGNTTSFASHIFNNATTTDCTATTGSSTSTVRPNIVLVGQTATSGVGTLAYSWNDASSTTGNVLTVSPSATTTYTVSGYNSTTGCTGTKAVTVTVYTPPTAPSVTNASQCGSGVPTVAVADTNGYTTPTFKWYADNTTTTALQSSTSLTYTTSISATTTFYVSVVSPGGCESPRTAVTATIVTPATLTVSNAASVCTGGTTTLTANGAVTYTWSPAATLSSATGASVVATPTANTTYTVVGVDANGCTTASKTIAVTILPYPSAVTIAQGASSVCAGSAISLTANGGTVGGSGTATVGTGTSLTATSSDLTVFENYWYQNWQQYLFTKAELNAMGITAGNITSIAFNISATPSPNTPLDDYNVKIASTSSTALSAFTTTGLTNVFGPSTVTPVVGVNTISFATPYAWDGVSNIIIDVRQTGHDGSANATTYYTTTSNNSVVYGYTTSSNTSFWTSSPTANVAATRPNVTFGFNTTTPILPTWSPTTGLYTNAAATTPYTGGAASVVYAVVNSDTTYTASASNGGCATTATTTITPIAKPDFTLTDATICNGTSTSLTANGSGNSYSWSPSTGLSSTTGATVTANPTATTTYTVVATNNTTGCQNTKQVVVTVNNPVVISSITPLSNNIAVGQNTSFTVAATGTGLAYQWQVNDGSGWANIADDSTYAGSNSATLSLTAPTGDLNGFQYHCVVSGTSTCDSQTSADAALNVDLTGIVTQPVDTTVCAGTDATFTTVATTVDPDPAVEITYSWEVKVGTADFASVSDGYDATTGLTFSNSSTGVLTMSGTTVANNGLIFHCIVNGYIPSSDVTLHVATPVAIATSPSDQTICNGANASFSVSATGDSLTYQWQVSTDNGSTWTNVSGATSSTLSVNGATSTSNGYQYHAVVSGSSACSSATSSAATLYINNPTITSQPSAVTLIAGDTATYSVSASAATSYQWQRATTVNGTYANVTNATPTGVTYSGATSATLSVITSGTTASGSANFYRCVVTNSGCTVTSNGAQLTVNNYCTPTGTTSTSYYMSKVSTTNGVSNFTNSSTLSTGGYANYAATTSCSQYRGYTVSVSLTSASQDDYYYCWIDWNNNGSFTDAGETIFATTSYSAGYTGTVTVPSGQAYGNYRMRVANSYSGVINSCGPNTNGEYEDYTFSVIPIPACSGTPTAGTAVASQSSICYGGSTALSLNGSTSGVSGISYQWYSSADNATFAPISGATAATYSASSLTANVYYYCAVTCANSGITSTSNTVTITVNNPQIVSTTPGSTCGAGTVTLGATANAGATINWYAAATGGVALASGTSYTTPSISATTTYYVEAVTGGGAGNAGGTYTGTSTNGTNVGSHGISITTTVPNVKINSVDIPFTGTGTITVSLMNSSASTTIASVTSGTVTGAGTSSVTIPLNLTVATAGSYTLIVTGYTGTVNNLGYAAVTYPSTALSGAFSVTAGYWYGSSTTSMYLFNLNVSTGCSSSRTPVVATFGAKPTATISYTGSPFCNNAAAVNVNLTGTNAYTGGTFTAPSGLTLNGSTGTIDPSTSTPGTYTVTYTTNATAYCAAQTATTSVVINQSVLTADFTYSSASYCTANGTVTPTVTGTSGTFTASPSGLTLNGTTGAINIATSTPGSYTVTNAVNACSNSVSSSVTVNVYQSITIGTQPSSATICPAASATFTAAGTGSNVTYQWQVSTDNGATWSDVSGATSASLTVSSATVAMSGNKYRAVVSDDNSATCGSVNTAVATLTISQPAAPVFTPTAATVCPGGIATLTVNGSSVNSYSNSFDALPSNFTVSGTSATATLNTTYHSEGTGSVLFNTTASSATASYAMNSNVNLGSVTSAKLTFSHIALMEGPTTSYDYGYVEYSADGGTTWTTFPTSSYAGTGTLFNSAVSFSTMSYADWIANNTSSASTPTNALWKSETINIPTSALTSQFRVRFRYTTDITVNYYGWLIDNVKISTANATVWSPSTGLYTNAAATTAYTGGNAATVYAMPSSSTTYTVTNTNNLGCTNSATIDVTVLPTPTLSGISQPTITCAGASTTFALTGMVANSTSTVTYNVNGGTAQTVTGVTADASGNATFTLALAGFTNGQTLTVTNITRTDVTTSCSSTISSGNTVVIAVRSLVTYYADADGDGYGNYNVPQITCQGQPSGYVTDSTDCNDSNAAMHTSYSFYADTDADGYGAGHSVTVCAVDAVTPPAGYSVNNTDCNDADATVHATATYYVDADGDGYGSTSSASLCAASAPTGYSANNTDCNDADATAHATATYYVDADGDGFGSTTSASLCAATAPAGYATNNTDCNDAAYSTTNTCAALLNLKVVLQGYYDADAHAMRPVSANEGVGTSDTDVDTVTVELHDASGTLVSSASGMLQTDGTVSLTFAPVAGDYYIVVSHRNTVASASASTVSFVSGATTTYDFTTADSQAYGDNQIMVDTGVYALYTGDLNQDGYIDVFDFPAYDNDNLSGYMGYYATDINGDGFVDVFDFPIYDLNNLNGVASYLPY